MYAAEVRVGARLEVLRRRPRGRAGGRDLSAERGRFELDLRVRQRIGDPGRAVTRSLARGDRVVEPLAGLEVRERDRLALRDHRRVLGRAREAEVAQLVLEVEDVEVAAADALTVGELARVGQVGLVAAVVAVLAQVAVRRLAAVVDAGAEGALAARPV